MSMVMAKWEYTNYDENLAYSEQESDDDDSEDEEEAEVAATSQKGIESEANFNNNGYSSGGEMTLDLQKLEETHIIEKSVVKKANETAEKNTQGCQAQALMQNKHLCQNMTKLAIKN